MNGEEFVAKMKVILEKAGDASDMSLGWPVVSTDPDCVSDFGCDYEGNLVINGVSFPFNIKDLSAIRYRWNEEYYEGFFRFNFGDNVWIDSIFSECNFGEKCSIQYFDKYIRYKNPNEALSELKKWMSDDNKIQVHESEKNSEENVLEQSEIMVFECDAHLHEIENEHIRTATELTFHKTLPQMMASLSDEKKRACALIDFQNLLSTVQKEGDAANLHENDFYKAWPQFVDALLGWMIEIPDVNVKSKTFEVFDQVLSETITKLMIIGLGNGAISLGELSGNSEA